MPTACTDSTDDPFAAPEASHAGAISAAPPTLQALLDGVDALGGMERAKALLAQAEHDDDERAQAHAHLLIAQAARLAARFQDARHHAEHAALSFQSRHDPGNESLALSIQAYAASNLGRNDEAVEAALLGVRVAEQQPSMSQRVLALNDLGVAYFWARSFLLAQTTFVEAIRLAHQAPQASMLQPVVNRCCAETIRLVIERYQRGRLPDVERHSRLLEMARPIVLQDTPPPEQPERLLVMAQVLWKFGASLNAAWRGDLAQARRHQGCAQHQFPYGSRTWIDPLYLWAQAEIHWAEGDLPQARALAQQMVHVASEIQYEQVAQIGLLMSVQLCEAQGQHDEAMALLRQLQQREQRVRVDSLASRSQAVQWRLDARDREREVSAWTERAQALDALSHQDELTGLANRRGFERDGTQALQAPATVSLALVDIDRFKQVNDRHSHQVGDGVLHRIAAILSASAGPLDLVARLAGDEFVVLFKDGSLSAVQRACARMRQDVARADWAALAPGLRVSISIGLAQARTGDTLAALLHRADLEMYADKGAAQR